MMRRTRFVVALTLVLAGCRAADDQFSPDTIIGLERGALERWGRGDPDGFLSIMAAETTYFDPTTTERVDGRAALAPLIDVSVDV